MTASYASLLQGTTSPGLFSWRGAPSRDLAAEAEAAGWQALRLDSCDVTSLAGFYEAVAQQWALPSWFGRNLDALFDVLGDLATGPTVLVWHGWDRLVQVDPGQAVSVLAVLRDAVGQAPAFAVVVVDVLEVSDFDGLL